MSQSNGIRLQKFIAAAGVCSRRAVEVLILDGQVSVNGKPADLGQRITPGIDRVVVQGRLVEAETAVPLTLAMNKPKGYICSHGDPHHKRTIYDLLPRELAARRFLCAGRLDLDSEGLLILTTDGELANQLMHPANQIVKRYRVSLNRPFPVAKISVLLRGVENEGELVKAEKAFPIKTGREDELTDWELHLHHGRKREIRRLFETLGYRVKRLKRFQIGRLSVRRIPLGKSKVLTEREIKSLFSSDETESRESFF